VNLLDRLEIYQIDPFSHHATATLIHRFSEVTGLPGIVEITSNVLAVIAGNYTIITAAPSPGSFSVWKVDLCRKHPQIGKIADIAEAAFLDGMARLNSHAVMLAD
jgi:hypothetical protein